MNTSSAKLLVLVGKEYACVKIIGRANFTSSIDFRTLLTELRQKGYNCFILDLSECLLMDSTFLGVLSGFGLKMSTPEAKAQKAGIRLLNPNARITELLENLGVLDLFQIVEQAPQTPSDVESITPAPVNPSREEITRTCLEAHQTLMAINPENVERFKEVTLFLAEDLKKLKAAS